MNRPVTSHLSTRADSFEPLYAASPTVLFVLSREIELHMEGDGGRIVAGSVDTPFTRVQ